MLLGFKKRFIEPIQKGTKVFTLRTKPKRMPKVGETLYMYSALRTKQCAKISDKETLIGIQRVRLLLKRSWEKDDISLVHLRVAVDGRWLNDDEISQFVQFDGFTDLHDFAAFWLGDKPGAKRRSKKSKDQIAEYKIMFHWTDLKY